MRSGSANRACEGGNRAASRVLAVLTAFVDGAPSLGVTELSRRLGLGKGVVFRALTTLTAKGVLVRDSSGFRYQLGLRMLDLSQGPGGEPALSGLCMPFMQRMFELSGETVTLSVPTGRVSVIIGGVEGRGPIARRVPLGRMTPLHVSSASRAILAHLADDEIDVYLSTPLEVFTATTLVDRDQLWQMIREVRAAGYALGYGDHIAGVGGVGFPVLDHAGSALGSVTVSGPASRLTDPLIHELRPALKRVANDLNRRGRARCLSHRARRGGHQRAATAWRGGAGRGRVLRGRRRRGTDRRTTRRPPRDRQLWVGAQARRAA